MSIWSAVVSCLASTAADSLQPPPSSVYSSVQRLQQQTVYNGKAADSLQPPPSSVYSIYRDSVQRLQQQTVYNGKAAESAHTYSSRQFTEAAPQRLQRMQRLPRQCTASTAADSVQHLQFVDYQNERTNGQ
jgi:hypothetical protein